MLGLKANVEAKNDFSSIFLIRSALDSEVGFLKLLIEHGVDVNTCDRVEFIALHFAASNNKVNNTRFLLESSASINSRREHDNTLLLLAISSNSYNTLRLLLVKLNRNIPYYDRVNVLLKAAS